MTISPSAVVYSRSERHVEEMAEVCTWLAGRGYRVCLVPHTLRVGRPDPKICDLAVCNLVAEGCSEEARPAVVSDDLSPMELKGIISQAWIHVGARYHSVVAALSSGVPCLSLSWHGKYRDIMRKYGSEEFVYDGVSGETDQFKQLFDRLDKDHEDIAATLAERHSTVADEVKENARMMAGLLKERTKS